MLNLRLLGPGFFQKFLPLEAINLTLLALEVLELRLLRPGTPLGLETLDLTPKTLNKAS